jgi:hypothetical protein
VDDAEHVHAEKTDYKEKMSRPAKQK